MSRSVRRRPFAAYCGGSQKKAKVCCNRTLRHHNRLALYNHGEGALFALPDEVMSAWEMPQDGSRGYRPWPRRWTQILNRQVVYQYPPPDPAEEYYRWFRWAKAK